MLLAFNISLMFNISLHGFKEKSESQTKVSTFFLLSKIEKFALRSFETKIGFGIGLPYSYLKTKPESALRKHRNVSPGLGG